MSKKNNLVVVESPAKAKTIQKYLGGEYIVRHCLGHVMDLPKSRMGVDIEDDFKPHYVIIPGKRRIVNSLKKEAAGKQNIYLASDPDREGEAIGWHLKILLGEGKNTYRVRFHEITREAIQRAFRNPEDIDPNKVDAQQARRVLDRILGYNLSPLLWRKVGRGLSAGRVQSVALRLIVEREKEILAFQPEEYWEIEVELAKLRDERSFKAKLVKIGGRKPELKSQAQAEEVVEALKGGKFRVLKIEEKEKRQSPPPPFTTSTLQQEAYNKLKFSASKTMLIAQQLYEGLDLGEEGRVGLITYMRTDSLRIAETALSQIRAYISEEFGREFLSAEPRTYKTKKKAQEAHEAIRPTAVSRHPQKLQPYLSSDQLKLYELIWKRALASQMSSLRYLLKSVEIESGEYIFRASGRRILFPGFTVLFPAWEEKLLPELSPGEELELINVEPSQHFTKPPPRYNDASLVKVLEEKGIGRPSTYAPTIQTIISRNYVRRRSGQLVPSELGVLVTNLLIRHFPKVLDFDFTASIEEELDKVEMGERRWQEVVRQFYSPFWEQLQEAHKMMRNVKSEAEQTEEICELCGRKMVIRWSRYGRFLSCSGFPQCRNSRALGTGVKCPREDCGGELVERRNKRGRIFYGCSNYPKCDFTSNKLPEGR